MNGLQRVGAAFMAGYQAFREVAFGSGVEKAAEFESYAARCLRYSVNWAYYENTQYVEAVHSWARANKEKLPQLYKYIDGIVNPFQRDGDFWQAAIWRGALSPTAADEGAIPITIGEKADESTLRGLIARVNAWSNWNANMSIHTLRGAVLGDAVIYIRDDRERKQSRLENLHPSELVECELDNMGYVKSYAIEYMRIDNEGKSAKYRETCRHLRDGETLYNTDGTLATGKPWILFETFRDGAIYTWADNPSTNGENWWITNWGFSPLVLTKHIDVGLDFGYCEFHAQIKKVDRANDTISLLLDQVRKTVNAKWGVTGDRPTATIRKTATTPTSDRPEPEREEENIIYFGAGSTFGPMVAPVEIAQVLTVIEKIEAGIEKDLPELNSEVWSGGGGPSSDTIESARGKTKAKVELRRTNYDNGYVRAVQMAITIAALAGYEGFAGYDGESYAKGQLDFSVSARPAFPPQPSEERAETTELWDSWAKVSDKVDFRTFALSYGWSDEQITATEKRMAAMNGETIPESGQ